MSAADAIALPDPDGEDREWRVAEVRDLGRNFAAVAAFQDDMVRSAQRSRRVAWWVAGAATVAACGLAASGDRGRRGASAAPSGVMDRTFAVLRLLAENADGLPISAIADRLGIPLSASHRLLSELAGHGVVQQERGHGDYRLTMRLVTLAFTYLARSGVTDIAQPVLDRLAARSGELVRLAVMDGDGANRSLTWVARAQGAQSGLRYDPEMGQVAPLSCSASGWAWLSTLGDEEALALVERQGFGPPEEFGPRAPRTPSSPATASSR